MKNKLGKQTFQFPLKPRIIGSCSIVGEKEGKGPMAKWFDIILYDITDMRVYELHKTHILKVFIKDTMQI
jgi:stage V sporulation protein AD